MSTIDPTYLRTIRDGLRAGTLHPDNAAALPSGLVGLYEQALPPHHRASDRQRLLDFLAAWALLRKEASATLVASLLPGWDHAQVLEAIATHSRWFNAPAPGRYLLYHERLRSFVLQRITAAQARACNQAIIHHCRQALQGRTADEWEHYALEHQGAHLLIPAMEQGDAADLKTLAYSTAHWNRQVEVSKGYAWSKELLNHLLQWAARYDDDEIIECALNKVDLHHLEQNDAPRIVELVAQNDLDAALQRIEAFGGNDAEGLRRKFTLYMLCLMELTLLHSKDKPFRRAATTQILQHLDTHLPVDHSVLKWNDFFPSYLLFRMACQWAEMGLDYMVVYKRTRDWEKDWITPKGPYNDNQFEVLLTCARGISDMFESVLPALATISTELAKQGKSEEADSAMQESIECARGMSDGYWKSSVLKDISTELAKQGKSEEAASAMQKSLECARGMSDVWKSSVLEDISTELAKQGKSEESLECARGISDDNRKIHALADISTELAKQGKTEEAASAMQESIECARGISVDVSKSRALADISTELAKQGKSEESLECARGMSDGYWKSRALAAISTELAKQGKSEEAASAMQESIECARGISDDDRKIHALAAITTELAKQGKTEEAASAMQETLECAKGISDDDRKIHVLAAISTELAKQNKVDEALACARGISDGYWKCSVLKDISTEMAKQGKSEEAASAMQKSLECAPGMSDG
jgi:tetratricopeptide (TPR) repeat protein